MSDNSDKLIGMKVPIIKAKPSLEDLQAELNAIRDLMPAMNIALALKRNDGKPTVVPVSMGDSILHRYDQYLSGSIETIFQHSLANLMTTKFQQWQLGLLNAIFLEQNKRQLN